MGIRDRPISPGSPWQNGVAERLIGTLRRECLDQLVIFGEAHLRRILSAYAGYYNQTRPHLTLQKDAPLRRAVQRVGSIATSSICTDMIFGKDTPFALRRISWANSNIGQRYGPTAGEPAGLATLSCFAAPRHSVSRPRKPLVRDLI